MSLELTKLKSENMIYKVEGDPYKKVFRRVWRDMSIKSYKWRLTISILSYSEDFSEEFMKVVFECKNYTRDTLTRRFKEWRESYASSLKLEKFEQFFFTE